MENSPTKLKREDIDWDEIDEQRKHLWIFGRDAGEIPCFRSSFLTGIGSGFGAAIGKWKMIEMSIRTSLLNISIGVLLLDIHFQVDF